jgi:hypothetical protein
MVNKIGMAIFCLLCRRMEHRCHTLEVQRVGSALAGFFSPLDRNDSTASNTASPTHPVLQIQHPMSRLQPKPGQESWREQRRMGARGTIDLHEISRPEILDPGRIQRDHLRARRSSFVRRTPRAGPRRRPGTNARSGVRSRLCGFLELLEPKCQPVSIRAILIRPRPFDQSFGNPLQPESEEWPVMNFEQPARDMDAEIRVDPDQVGIEGRMMNFGQRQTIRDDWLPQPLISIHQDVSGIEEPRLR